MLTPTHYKKGDWNAICDECGFQYKASQLRKRWDGFRVCDTCWEPEHPQDNIRGVRDKQSVPWTRPDSAREIGPSRWFAGNIFITGLWGGATIDEALITSLNFDAANLSGGATIDAGSMYETILEFDAANLSGGSTIAQASITSNNLAPADLSGGATIAQASFATPTYQAFTANDTWTVPAGVTSVVVKAWGAGGGGGASYSSGASVATGGGGGFAQATITVTPAETLLVRVGGAGGVYINDVPDCYSVAGTNGGGNGGAKFTSFVGGGGGGYSGLFRSTTPLVIAAGGGGGGSGNLNSYIGGEGGDATGGDGKGTYGGGGGTQTGGGTATSPATAGSSLVGGNGASVAIESAAGGGGGGGYYGGGGGCAYAPDAASGGGGGSGYVTGSSTTLTQASSRSVANSGDADYPGGGVGDGGTGLISTVGNDFAYGGNGYVYLDWS